MSTLKLSLDTRRQKQDKTYPLVFRISVNGESRDLPLGNSIPGDQWNSRTETLKKTAPAYEVLSGKIQEMQIKYLGKIVEYEKLHTHVTAQALKDYILHVEQPVSKIAVASFWQQEIEHLMQI